MRFRASTLALAGLAPLMLALALVIGVTTGYAATGGGDLAQWRWGLTWGMLAAGAIAMAGAAWAWDSEPDLAPRRLWLGYGWAAALGMAIFVYVVSYLG
ncbi:hypothetical protein RN607_01930 [Demequina capsici]|uniref:Uncharacterized protein n=1 Tax=Demequina capsici TaxID=3075620 RepID=A0AA96FCE1_9MICO|nr:MULTISPECIES: hypothetical protein [unclassified Demequina]WNM24883.1 hypothetical protein RN606_01660 [Demequina sp. OYTSA14]WNM27789.1 hypothetical protein RN607_01930 [Demequina sp. PMTSA13]